VHAPRIFPILLVSFAVGLGLFAWSMVFGGPVTYMSDLVGWAAAGWTILSVVLVVAAMRRITHPRFAGERRASVRFDGAGTALLDGVPMRVHDVSLTGIRVAAPIGSASAVGAAVRVSVAGVELDATVREVDVGADATDEVRLQFADVDRTALAQLAVRLFRTLGTPRTVWESE
jgi:hypothetical protein